MFDSADVYSDGAAEEVFGKAIQGRRDKAAKPKIKPPKPAI
jgi:aryl-alcohol dehydrogenase-like predicted oxidoreductase